MKRVGFLAVLTVLSARAVIAEPAASDAVQFVPKTRIEKAAYAVMERFSEKELREIQGFFAPVCRKWYPTGEKFAAEYTVASNKSAVLSRYLPKARAVIDDAIKMKVPARFEAQKNRYITTAEGLYSVVDMYLKIEAKLR